VGQKKIPGGQLPPLPPYFLRLCVSQRYSQEFSVGFGGGLGRPEKRGFGAKSSALSDFGNFSTKMHVSAKIAILKQYSSIKTN